MAPRLFFARDTERTRSRPQQMHHARPGLLAWIYGSDCPLVLACRARPRNVRRGSERYFAFYRYPAGRWRRCSRSGSRRINPAGAGRQYCQYCPVRPRGRPEDGNGRRDDRNQSSSSFRQRAALGARPARRDRGEAGGVGRGARAVAQLRDDRCADPLCVCVCRSRSLAARRRWARRAS